MILRDLLLGATTFSQLAAGAPGLSRMLLTTRLRELERAGVVRVDAQRDRTALPLPAHRGRQGPGRRHGGPRTWGERWMELAPEHLDPGVVLHSWVSWYLAVEHLPERRVVARFQFPGLPSKGAELWIIFDGDRSEVCRKDPGFEVELLVEAEPGALAEWHLGRIEWADALRTERIRVLGPSSLARSLPTWNRRSPTAHVTRTALDDTAGAGRVIIGG